MKNNPKVSIVIPAYNASAYLNQSIDSALNQTYKNIEVIVVNDGSKDDGKTEEIALSYGDKIRYFKKENGGCASALNYGISKMQGEWFSWLSHDDLYYENKIEKELELLEKNGSDENTVISCEADIIDENGKKIFHPAYEDEGLYSGANFFKRMLIGKELNGCGLLISKKVIDKVGFFNEKLVAMPDWEYWVRISVSEFSLLRIGKEHLVCNRVHSGQVSNRCKDKWVKEYQLIVNDVAKKIIEDKDVGYLKELYLFSVVKNIKDAKFLLKEKLLSDNEKVGLITIKGKFKRVKSNLRGFCAKLYWKMFRR